MKVSLEKVEKKYKNDEIEKYQELIKVFQENIYLLVDSLRKEMFSQGPEIRGKSEIDLKKEADGWRSNNRFNMLERSLRASYSI